MEYSNVGRLVLVGVILLCLLFLRSPRKKIFVYPRKTGAGKLFVMSSVIRGIAVVLTVLWTFHIQRIDGSSPQHILQRHTVILLDGSLSMSATDVAPNRFQHAKELISDIISADSGAEYSLIVFSGLPVVRVPRTHDLTGMQTVVSGMNLGDFPATDTFLGTALGDALLLSLQQFAQLPTHSNRSIIIISDGDSNKGYDPNKTLSLLTQESIPVYFIALGEDGYEVGKDVTGLPVITSFDTDLMQQFTDQTEGKLYRNPTDEAVEGLTKQLVTHGVTHALSPHAVVYLPREISLNAYLTPRLLVCFFMLLCLSGYAFVQRSRSQ